MNLEVIVRLREHRRLLLHWSQDHWLWSMRLVRQQSHDTAPAVNAAQREETALMQHFAGVHSNMLGQYGAAELWLVHRHRGTRHRLLVPPPWI